MSELKLFTVYFNNMFVCEVYINEYFSHFNIVDYLLDHLYFYEGSIVKK